jgi:hypothetical protein
MNHRNRAIPFILVSFLLSFARIAAGATTSFDVLAGYQGGAGGQAGITIADFAQDLPLRARIGVGFTHTDPGNAEEAREIFINDATNGTPEKSGHVWDYRFDLAVPIRAGIFRETILFGGPRYSSFTGSFRYVGGNEDFDVRSRQWGIGGGLESALAMTGATEIVIGGAADYYRAAPLAGHDTTYDPAGDDVNSRKDFTYDDADESIHQPDWVFSVLLGVRHRFGGGAANRRGATDNRRQSVRSGKRL